MESTLWLGLLGAVLVATIVAWWNPDIEATAYAGVAQLFGSWLLAYGATNYQVVSGGTTVGPFVNPGVALLLFLNGIGGIIAILVAVYDHYYGEQKYQMPEQASVDQGVSGRGS